MKNRSSRSDAGVVFSAPKRRKGSSLRGFYHFVGVSSYTRKLANRREAE